MKTANAQISDGLYLLSVEMIWYYEIWTCVMQVWVIAVSRAHTQNFGWVKIEFLMWLSQIECRCERNATNTQSIYRMHPSGFRCVCVCVFNDGTVFNCSREWQHTHTMRARWWRGRCAKSTSSRALPLTLAVLTQNTTNPNCGATTTATTTTLAVLMSPGNGPSNFESFFSLFNFFDFIHSCTCLSRFGSLGNGFQYIFLNIATK